MSSLTPAQLAELRVQAQENQRAGFGNVTVDCADVLTLIEALAAAREALREQRKVVVRACNDLREALEMNGGFITPDGKIKYVREAYSKLKWAYEDEVARAHLATFAAAEPLGDLSSRSDTRPSPGRSTPSSRR